MIKNDFKPLHSIKVYVLMEEEDGSKCKLSSATWPVGVVTNFEDVLKFIKNKSNLNKYYYTFELNNILAS